jgi:hypothetical protein
MHDCLLLNFESFFMKSGPEVSSTPAWMREKVNSGVVLNTEQKLLIMKKF